MTGAPPEAGRPFEAVVKVKGSAPRSPSNDRAGIAPPTGGGRQSFRDASAFNCSLMVMSSMMLWIR